MTEGDASIPPPASGRGSGGGPPRFRHRNTPRAKELRNNATSPERLLWQRLRNRQLEGHKFSRQIPIGPFFADFLCREAKLVVELDGGSHDDRLAEDERRDAFLRSHGYEVLRFQNAELLNNLDGVLQAISVALSAAHP